MGEPCRSVLAKVGGSLYDLPDLRERLAAFSSLHRHERLLLFPGGGITADVVRHLDRLHGLGDEAAHWLALRCLALNARFLGVLLPEFVPIDWVHPLKAGDLPVRGILDPLLFAEADEGETGALPHRWEVTSDSLAVRCAGVLEVDELVLLKSVGTEEDQDPLAWLARGWVDPYFPTVLGQFDRLPVRWLNLRSASWG